MRLQGHMNIGSNKTQQLHRKRNRSMTNPLKTSAWDARQRRLRNAAESEEDKQQRRLDVYSQNYVLRCSDRQQELHDLQNTKYKVHKKRFLKNECVPREGIYTCP